MRYFLISYAHNDGFGNFIVESNNFPSQKQLILHLKENEKFTRKITIQNIFEFKSKEDYQKFTED